MVEEERKNIEESLRGVLVPENLVRRIPACQGDCDAINFTIGEEENVGE